jgi:hypothetical protein
MPDEHEQPAEKPEQPAEGALIQRGMIRQRLSARQAATKAGMSEGRWRQIVAGYQSARGQHIPVTAPPATLARMAQAVGLTPDELTEAGRSDAAEVLADLASSPMPAPVAAAPDGVAPLLSKVMHDDRLTEAQKTRVIEILIAAAQSERKRAEQRLNEQLTERADELIRLLSED